MANLEHLQILNESVDAWNHWRSKQPDLKPDLSDADLIGRDLSNADLSHTNLTSANLTGADLTGTDLRGAQLNHACLNHAKLGWVNSTGAEFESATFICTPTFSLHMKTSLLARGAIPIYPKETGNPAN